MASAPHATRDHATWSASATKRNWLCAGALALTEDLPETTSREADWGTVCHEVAEKVLRGNGPADRFIGQVLKGKVHEFEFDQEMAECTQFYVDYVVKQIDSSKDTTLRVEQHFSLDDLKPPFDAGGTADAVIYYPGQKLIEVVDLKTGRGVVVDVKGNPQLRSYALGAMLANPGLDVERIRSTIVQPRAGHPDGRTRSETYHIAELVEWTTDLVAAMKQSAEARFHFHGSSGLSRIAWADKWLVAGDHCRDTFCKARGTCPAVERAVHQQISGWWEPSGEMVIRSPKDDPVLRGRKLDLLPLIEAYIAAFREDEHRRAEAGDLADGYVLVEAEGREKWNEGVEEKVRAAAKQAGLSEAKYINPGKLRTPKQIRKELGTNAKLVADLSTTPKTGFNLVRSDKTTREPVLGTAARYFEPSN